MNTTQAIELLKNAGFKVTQAPGGSILVGLNRHLDALEVFRFFAHTPAANDAMDSMEFDQIGNEVGISGLEL